MRLLTVVCSLLPALLPSALAPAQCQNLWTGSYGCPGVAGEVRAAVRWDPDGAGPLPEQLAVGGIFRVAGDVACTSLALWDPASGVWSALPMPIPAPLPFAPYVTALAVLPNGDLVAAVLQYLSSSTLASVERWNGSTWTTLGLPFDDAIEVLHVRPTGELLAGGAFAQVGGQNLGQLVRWTGSAWQPFAGGAFGEVHDVVERSTGELVVGGAVTVAGVGPQAQVAQWNGTAWTSLGALPGAALALAQTTNGQLFVGAQSGLFVQNGAAWLAVPGLDATPYPTARVDELQALPTGALVVGGMFFAAGGQPTNQIAVLDPLTLQWSTLGAGISNNYAFTGRVDAVVPLANGDLVVGGNFGVAGDVDVLGIARHDGIAWHALSSGPGLANACAVAIDDVQFVVGGRFRTIGDFVANSVALWNGAVWQPLGAGLIDPTTASASAVVVDLLRLDNGDLLAAGEFGPGLGAIARWDGVAWSPFVSASLGSGTGLVGRMQRLPNGDLAVAGQFTSIGGVSATNVARWDGATWSAFGSGNTGPVVAMAVEPSGALLVADRIGVHRWDGVQWSSIAAIGGNNTITSIAPTRDGGVMIGGYESPFFGPSTRGWVEYQGPAGYLHEDTEISPGWIFTTVRSLVDGDVLVTGQFGTLGGQAVSGYVRFDHPPFGARETSLDGTWFADAAPFPNGDLLMVGGATGLGGGANFGLARLTTTCPAIAPTFGAGCAGSGGLNELRVLELPWLGATFRSEATGLPGNSLAIDVFGMSSGSVPLQQLLPQGQPGCDLLVAPDVLLLRFTGAGSFQTTFALPDVPTLLGARFFEQVVALEFGAQGAITAITSSNAVAATAGIF